MAYRDSIRASLGSYPIDENELAEFIDAMDQPISAGIRVRPETDLSFIPFQLSAVPWHHRSFRVEDSVRPAGCLAYGAAQFYIQDPASLLAIRLLDAKPGEAIADLCASPGGKSTAILEDLGERGWLLANEAIRSRVGVLEFSLQRQSASNFVVANSDVAELSQQLDQFFDGVLVDAPCSGQSLVARGKQSKSAFSEHQVEHSAARQARILSAAACLVRPGGRLVYSTCTFAPTENELQVVAFLARHPDFMVEPCPALTVWQSRLLPGCYRLWPHRDQCGGAFAVRLRRSDEGVAPPAPTIRVAPDEEEIPAELQDWGALHTKHVQSKGPRCFAWEEKLPPALRAVAYSGPEVSYRAGSTWFPSYSLALRSATCWRPTQVSELSDRDAAAYLEGNTIPLASRGWMVARWKGLPLGWLKADGRQGKNHLPKQARLRITSYSKSA